VNYLPAANLPLPGLRQIGKTVEKRHRVLRPAGTVVEAACSISANPHCSVQRSYRVSEARVAPDRAQLWFPVHPTLAAIIADTPIAGQMTYLVSVTEAAFSSAGFGNAFREWCDEANMPKHCSSHGLRKAACRRLAEAGCSEHEIAAISGHESLAEVRRYTRAASRVKMARSAMATVTQAFPNGRG
jgi:Phage integrase family